MNDNTLLYRVINSNYVQGDVISSQAFRPRPIDRKRLSAYGGDQISPDAAWRHYTRDPSDPPTGVLAVTVAECHAERLPVQPDPEPFPEHVLIDFTAFGTNQIKRKSESLRDNAVVRGWLFLRESVT